MRLELRLRLAEPGSDLAVGEPSGIQLMFPHREHRDPHDVPQFQRRIGSDVDSRDRKRPVEPDAAECAMGLLTEVAPGALVQRDSERRAAMGAQTHEREAAPEIPAKHG